MRCNAGPAMAMAIAIAIAIGNVSRGCASPPTVFYALAPLPGGAVPAKVGAAPKPADAAPLRVDAVHLPSVLNRPEIFLRKGPNLLQVDDFARWAGPLGEMAQGVLTQDLMSRLPAGRVVYPDAPLPANTAGLKVEVLAFDARDGSAGLSVAWYLGGRSRQLQLETPLRGSGAAAEADALSRLLALLADDIAAHLDGGPGG